MITETSIFTDPDAHPLTLYLLCIKKLEEGWTDWIPETVTSEIKRIFKATISRENSNKLQAAKLLHSDHHDAFWQEWEVFQNVILTLNGIPPSINTMHAPNTAEIMNGIEIANLITKLDFNEEISRYVAACLLFDEVHYAPPPIDFCQPYISQPMYKCKDCTKTSSALPPFSMRCESCAGTYTGSKVFNFKPKNDEKGHNLEFFLTYEFEPIKVRYDQLLKEKEPYINEVGEDIQAAKLIVAHDFSMLKLQQFHEQAIALKIKS